MSFIYAPDVNALHNVCLIISFLLLVRSIAWDVTKLLWIFGDSFRNLSTLVNGNSPLGAEDSGMGEPARLMKKERDMAQK